MFVTYYVKNVTYYVRSGYILCTLTNGGYSRQTAARAPFLRKNSEVAAIAARGGVIL